MLQAKNLKKVYKMSSHEVVALNDVSFDLNPGQLVAIVGPSGCGKTSLMNILGALDSEFDGDVIINHKSLKEAQSKDLDSYRKNTIGFIFQHFTLINSLNALENVELAFDISNVSKSEKRQRAIQLLESVGLEDHMKKKVNRLSGGQKQRVAIARALANNPEIILADEPTGALDQKTGIQVMEILKEVAKNRLVIMVTHSPELAQKYANKIIEMEDGQIVQTIENQPAKAMTYQPKKETKSNMSFFSALRLSYRNLWLKKGRTAWTSIGLSIGIIGIALALALSTGTKSTIENQVKSIFPANSVMVNHKSEDQSIFNQKDEMTYSDVEKILTLSDKIDGYYFFPDNIMPSIVSPSKEMADITKFSENKQELSPTPPYFMANMTIAESYDGQLSLGHLPTSSIGHYEVLISQSTAENLLVNDQKTEALLNSKLYMSLTDFNTDENRIIEMTIAGITTENTMMNTLYINVESLFNVLEGEFNIKKEDIVSRNVVVFINDIKNVEKISKDLTDSQADYQFKGVASSVLSTVNTILDIVRNGLIAFSSISVIVAILMIAIVIYISVLERKQEIGIIRALGGRKKDIRNLFVGESLTIGFLAGSLGVFVAYLITFLINNIVYSFLLQRNPNAPFFAVASLDIQTAVILVLLCMIIAVISGLIPSLKAAKMDPVDAIRSK